MSSDTNKVSFLESIPIPPKGGGVSKRLGTNQKLLAQIKPGGCLTTTSEKKMLALRMSAWSSGIKIKVRQLPRGEGDPVVWGIWRVEEPNVQPN